MKFIAFCNRKGGSGKTTTAVHVAAGLSLLGRRVLLVDADPQGHATLWFYGNRDVGPGLYEILCNGNDTLASTQKTETQRLYLLPSSRKLMDFEADFIKKPGAAHLLKKALSKCESNFEYIIFDTPPYLGLLMLSVLMASSRVFITLPLNVLALDGLNEMLGLIEQLNNKTRNGPKFQGIIPVMYNRHLKSQNLLLKKLKKHFGKGSLFPLIRQNIRLAEAPEVNKHIYSFAPGSNGAHDYWCLSKAINKMIQI